MGLLISAGTETLFELLCEMNIWEDDDDDADACIAGRGGVLTMHPGFLTF